MKKALGFGVVILLSALPALGQCPSADTTRDCFVDLADFAVLAGQWLTEDPDKEAQDFALFASQWLTGNRLPSDMIIIPAGTFQMGDSIGDGYSNDRPVHLVTLDSFAMGKYEVTNAQYCAFLSSARAQGLITNSSGKIYKAGSGNRIPYCDTSTSNSSSQIDFSNNSFSVRTKGGKDMTNHPMIQISWYGAVAYCNWRSQQESKQICYDLSTWTCDFSKQGYRLPTEAEWEYAARGGLSGKRFPWGDTITHFQANYLSYWFGGEPYYFYDLNPTSGYHPTWKDGIKPYTAPVGSFPANGYGLYDMAGNVWELCNDWYSETYYSSSPQTNPTGPDTINYRVSRGGSWGFHADGSRLGNRSWLDPGNLSSNLGFRVVLKP
jgi:formylglycine-generating enzyme